MTTKSITIPAHPEGETMKAVCFSSYGKDPKEVLEIITIPKPFIKVDGGDDQVLIKVHACALNPIDKLRLNGDLTTMLPEQFSDNNVLGYDVSGVVEESSSSKFKVGDEVYVRLSGMNYGALSEYVVCNTAEIGTKPTNLSFSEAASVPLAALTALQSFKHAGVTEGSKVLITAGAGGVGSLAIQIAKKVLKAAYVCTTASPGKGTELCLAMGADRVVDYTSEEFETLLEGEEFDMVFDTTAEACKMGSLLKKEGGRVISISANLDFQKAGETAKSAGGSWEFFMMHPSGDELNELRPYFESGEMKAVIDTEADGMDDFMTAVDKLWSGRSKGKCVIKIV